MQEVFMGHLWKFSGYLHLIVVSLINWLIWHLLNCNFFVSVIHLNKFLEYDAFVCHLLGDPLYVPGGQPKCCDAEFTNESYALDGYRNVHINIATYLLVFSLFII